MAFKTIQFSAAIDRIATAGKGDADSELIVTLRIPHTDVQADILAAKLLTSKRTAQVFAFSMVPEQAQLSLFEEHAGYLEEELEAIEPRDEDEDAAGEREHELAEAMP